VKAVLSQDHGALVVVAADAEAEAARLGSQATCIEPRVLSDLYSRQASRIDGAILLDPQGACHAIGVVLDGQASVAGDRSRGARFNSAIRYVVGTEGRLAVVASDDGTTNLLPRLRPQVHERDLKEAAGRIRHAGKGPPHLPGDAELLYNYQHLFDLSGLDQEILKVHFIRGVRWRDDDPIEEAFDYHHTDVIVE
jgi:hypothetical protein